MCDSRFRGRRAKAGVYEEYITERVIDLLEREVRCLEKVNPQVECAEIAEKKITDAAREIALKATLEPYGLQALKNTFAVVAAMGEATNE